MKNLYILFLFFIVACQPNENSTKVANSIQINSSLDSSKSANNFELESRWIRVKLHNHSYVIKVSSGADNNEILIDTIKKEIVIVWENKKDTYKILNIEKKDKNQYSIKVKNSSIERDKEIFMNVECIDKAKHIAKWSFILENGSLKSKTEFIMVPKSFENLYETLYDDSCVDCHLE